MNKTLLLLITFPFFTRVQSQDSSHRPLFTLIRSTDLVVGISWQGNTRTNKTYRYYEIGIARGNYSYGIDAAAGRAVYASEEMYFGSDRTIFGTKIGIWFHWLLDAGMAAEYYTNLKKGNFKLRPELGFGMARVRLVMGYNFPTIGNKKFEELQHNNIQVTIQIALAIRKKLIAGMN